MAFLIFPFPCAMILMFQPSNRLEEPPITNAPCLLLSLRVTRLWSVAPDSAQSVTTFVGQLRANLIERRSVDLLREIGRAHV
mgnify:CR=1 FL=1